MMGKIKVGYRDGSGAGIRKWERGEGLALTTDDDEEATIVFAGDMDGCPAGVINREWADKLVTRYNAFAKDGLVERLVEFIKSRPFYQADPDGVVLTDLIRPIEVLVEKSGGE